MILLYKMFYICDLFLFQVFYFSCIFYLIHLSSLQAKDTSNYHTLTKQISNENNLPPAEASNQFNHWQKTGSLGENIKYKPLAPINHKFFPIRIRRQVINKKRRRFKELRKKPYFPFYRYKYNFSVMINSIINMYANKCGTLVYNWIMSRNWTQLSLPISKYNFTRGRRADSFIFSIF